MSITKTKQRELPRTRIIKRRVGAWFAGHRERYQQDCKAAAAETLGLPPESIDDPSLAYQREFEEFQRWFTPGRPPIDG
jgi:hypothetical protein